MSIAFETPDQPQVIALIAELDAYLYALYPAACVYALDLTELKREQVKFAVARDGTGAAVGCGAVLLTPGLAEIKRMYVRPAARGLGLARRMLERLEGAARTAGCPLLALETGQSQPEALALYENLGFHRCGPFGDYRDDPLSVFMHKPLAAHVPA